MPGGLIAFVSTPVVVVGAICVIGAASLAGVAGSNSTSATNQAATSYAKQLIPPKILAIEQSSFVKAECPGLSWTILGALTHLESNDGRNTNTSTAGAIGPNQFEPTTFDKNGQLIVQVGPYGKVPDGQGYAVDGNGDGVANIRDPYDSIPSAARLLCANGGGNTKTLPQALYAYDHAWWYVYGGESGTGPFEGVLPLAAKLGVTVQIQSGANNVTGARAILVNTANAVVKQNIPYVWAGGNAQGPTMGGFDCSGLMVYVYAQVGITLAHLAASQYYATKQYTVTTSINNLSQAQPGDLVFFRGSDGSNTAPGHVGIYIGNNIMVNAPQTGQNVSTVDITTPWRASDFIAITDPLAAKAAGNL